MASLAQPFSALFTFLANILKWCLDGFMFIIKNALFFIFDGLLTCISSIFLALDFSSFASSYAMNWAGLPPQFIWFVNAISLPTGLTMLAAAIGIRMALNLIPAAFTRI